MIDAEDRARLQQALDLAQRSIGLSDPNPRVGCVLAAADGRIVAQGHTQEAGGPHAEAHALQQAQAGGHSLNGGTAWVTLEPCAHHGRTPPCCDALVRSGLARVVVAMVDPFPRVAGQGLARLRASDLVVDVLDAEDGLAAAARDLNIGFLSRVERGRPWVRLKVAQSLDGRTALPNGVSQWITGPQARTDTHAWRKRAMAVVTGIGTALRDQPRLDVRLVPTSRQPLRVVVDSSLRLPLHSSIAGLPGRLAVATARRGPRAADMEAAGIEVLECGEKSGRVDLSRMLQHLHEREVNEVHIEAGATLNGSFLSEGLVDEVVAYVAPCLLGSGPGTADWGPIKSLDQQVRLKLVSAEALGDDIRLRYLRPAGRRDERRLP